MSSRSGQYESQPEGYKAFIPASLPPDPAIDMNADMRKALSRADQALGRLDGVATTLPDPDFFVAMYVRHEAVLSSQIEGTQSTLEDVLEFEADGHAERHPQDVEEVVNYVRAMNYGLERLEELPLSLRLLREIHGILLKDVRGENRNPGEFRDSQNWIGPDNCTLNEAEYVPPPPHLVNKLLGNLEDFLHQDETYSLLIKSGLAHAQFETIHPFLDGNGRLGRLLITFYLCEQGVLEKPLLYLSYFLKAHRARYYDLLMGVRHEGDWERWLRFFLRGVYETSLSASETARKIVSLREEHREKIRNSLTGSQYGTRLLDFLFQHPVTSVGMAEERLGCAYATAGNLIERFEELGILEETTGQKRNRRWRYKPYLDLFEQQSLPAGHRNQSR